MNAHYFKCFLILNISMLLFDMTPNGTKPSCMNKKMKLCPHYIYENLTLRLLQSIHRVVAALILLFILYVFSLFFPISSRRQDILLMTISYTTTSSVSSTVLKKGSGISKYWITESLTFEKIQHLRQK